MTDNEKIEKLVHWSGDYDKLSFGDSFPDYLNDDAAAMSLLDTLVEKGGRWEMFSKEGYVQIIIKLHYNSYAEYAHTRRAAVVAACLEMIGKEDV